ncbi:tRNA-dihydrouridine synthase B [Thermotomaculum hydrothermale]|uniref:tRNA-dihydrouridine synthase n=1 Tax=Thermotomaculum hydrothermale TaxID=981385 RepID=A0A7R6PII3_9BACT|nr:tRNA dihydrouridine synthase DusB [Thermotomaculum hydrothermale]BBB33234.1 tRNA-dihydrouridine synthase B [Thermotomaculum hydrothermale]
MKNTIEEFKNKKIKIGSLEVSPPTFLAPIADISDSVFRQIVKEFGGIGVVFSEMISADALTRGCKKTSFMLNFDFSEKPLFFQIVGKEPLRMAMAARMLEDLGADGIDINMGCPSKNVTKSGGGSALLMDLKKAEEIIRKVRKVLSIPLTIKIRAGWNENNLVYKEIGKIAENEGVDAVFFHGRTKKQMYSGNVNYEWIADLKSRLKIPVIGNGDIVGRESLLKMLETKCDGVMIARAAIKKPWIFKELLDNEKVEIEKLIEIIEKQFKRIMKIYPENLAKHKMKLFLSWYSRSLPKGKSIRLQLNDAKTSKEVLNVFENYRNSLLDK